MLRQLWGTVHGKQMRQNKTAFSTYELKLKIMSHNYQPDSLPPQTFQYSSLVLCNRFGARKVQISFILMNYIIYLSEYMIPWSEHLPVFFLSWLRQKEIRHLG